MLCCTIWLPQYGQLEARYSISLGFLDPLVRLFDGDKERNDLYAVMDAADWQEIRAQIYDFEGLYVTARLCREAPAPQPPPD